MFITIVRPTTIPERANYNCKHLSCFKRQFIYFILPAFIVYLSCWTCSFLVLSLVSSFTCAFFCAHFVCPENCFVQVNTNGHHRCATVAVVHHGCRCSQAIGLRIMNLNSICLMFCTRALLKLGFSYFLYLLSLYLSFCWFGWCCCCKNLFNSSQLEISYTAVHQLHRRLTGRLSIYLAASLVWHRLAHSDTSL